MTLKVISEKYLGDEAARLRFLREARAAASMRHPNVASVFHLGRKGRDYFYAMEFVEGETLDNLIKRSGPLEVKFVLLKKLAAFNTGLCVITTRLPIGDIAGPELSFRRIFGRAHCQR